MAMVRVFETNDEVERMVYRTLLQEAGIAVMEADLRAPSTIYGHVGLSRPRYALHVRPDQAEEALRLIEDYRTEVAAGAYQLPDEPLTAEDEARDDARQARSHTINLIGYILIGVLVLVVLVIVFGNR